MRTEERLPANSRRCRKIGSCHYPGGTLDTEATLPERDVWPLEKLAIAADYSCKWNLRIPEFAEESNACLSLARNRNKDENWYFVDIGRPGQARIRCEFALKRHFSPTGCQRVLRWPAHRPALNQCSRRTFIGMRLDRDTPRRQGKAQKKPTNSRRQPRPRDLGRFAPTAGATGSIPVPPTTITIGVLTTSSQLGNVPNGTGMADRHGCSPQKFSHAQGARKYS
jgi:hypothetical protein